MSVEGIKANDLYRTNELLYTVCSVLVVGSFQRSVLLVLLCLKPPQNV
jgi:hypothetical protein